MKLIDTPNMTLRDWFAGQALVNPATDFSPNRVGAAHAAEHAFEIADAMLAARKEMT